MNRNAVKLIGLTMVLVFGFMSATPFLAAQTDFYKNTANFSLDLGSLTLMALTHDVNGMPIGSASAITGVLALFGVALLVGVFTFAPVRKSRHVITHR